MKLNYFLPHAVIIIVLSTVTSFSQEAVITSGGDASGDNGSVSFTIGQVVYKTNSDANSSIAEGVQQPYEISVVSGIEESKESNIEFLIYPQPSNELIHLEIRNNIFSGLSYQLYDLNGKLLEHKKIQGTETSFSMEELPPAAYILKIYENANEIKTIKIIKN